MPIRFDKRLNRYRAPSGQFISPERVRREIEKAVELVKTDMRAIGERLNRGEINLPQFQIEMTDALKAAHGLAASIGKGGRKQMTAKDWGAVGNDLKSQYKYLNRLAREIELGKVSPVQIANRAAAYGNGLRASFYRQTGENERDNGRTMAKRVVHSKEGCAECASWAAKGFVSIDEQPRIGGLICGSFCKCHLVYK